MIRMVMYKTLTLFLFLLLWGCSDNDDSPAAPALPKEALLSRDFESGSIGEVVHISDYQWELSLADDNDNGALPDDWRNWWYVKIEKLKTDRNTEITIKNRGWSHDYLPVYSYNQIDWFHFQEKEVTTVGGHLQIDSEFTEETVWLARHFPYTLSDLENYLKTIEANPHIEITTPGFSREKRPLYLIRVSDFSTPVTEKRRIMIHSRTHPAETPSSFLIEGLINFLLSGTAEAQELLADHEFHIFPMQNVDGVTAGNYRTTTANENLEVLWLRTPDSPLSLTAGTPPEITTIHEHAVNLMSDGGPKVSIALNLHAANGAPDLKTFFFPHFGTEEQEYTPEEASLWSKQISFIDEVMDKNGADLFQPVITEGGRTFVKKAYPESWWWANFRDEVMAITLETTYGKSGANHRWSEPEDFRNLGASLAQAIGSYDENSPAFPSPRSAGSAYPFTEEELKE